MTLAELYRWSETKVSGLDEATLPSVSSTQLDKRSIFREGEREWVRVVKPFPKDAKFNCVAENYTYSITDNIPDFLEMREEGLWHYQTGSNSSSWRRLKPVTMRILDQIRPDWRNQSSSDFLHYYWQDGDILGTYYTPSTSVTNGFWAYYYATSSQMTATTDHPFSGSVNSTRLEPYHQHILTYYESKGLEILGYNDDAKAKLSEFYQLVANAKNDLEERKDLVQNAQVRPKFPRPRFAR